MRILFVMDGLERVDPEKDTSFGFIQAAAERGHTNLHCLIHEVSADGDRVRAPTRELRIDASGLSFAAERPAWCDLADDVDAVMIRKDPPFDDAYLYATLILERVKAHTLIVNDPRGLREANEKLYALNFSHWMPETVVTSDRERIHAFVASAGGRGVIKPLDGAGGFGVVGLRQDDGNARAIVDLLTREGAALAMVQRYLPSVAEGDKRVLMLDGEPMGAILRVPPEGELRSNIHVGGRVVPTELTERERALVADVGPRLREDGLFFVGLDVIGEHLTEVNVTSPTGIRELSAFEGRSRSADVIAWMEQRLSSKG
ncbi:MAG: glutathione synthase [Myxococcota bacterium]